MLQEQGQLVQLEQEESGQLGQLEQEQLGQLVAQAQLA
jgi:hypothetical protein